MGSAPTTDLQAWRDRGSSPLPVPPPNVPPANVASRPEHSLRPFFHSPDVAEGWRELERRHGTGCSFCATKTCKMHLSTCFSVVWSVRRWNESAPEFLSVRTVRVGHAAVGRLDARV